MLNVFAICPLSCLALLLRKVNVRNQPQSSHHLSWKVFEHVFDFNEMLYSDICGYLITCIVFVLIKLEHVH